LLNGLEREVYQAADRCWRLHERQVQLRGGVLRSKAVLVQETAFQPEAEQQELAGALERWRGGVQGAAASAALQVKVAEQQLVLAVGRCDWRAAAAHNGLPAACCCQSCCCSCPPAGLQATHSCCRF
jgi:hypothetical protein